MAGGGAGNGKKLSGKALKIAGGKPLNEAFLNNYFKVFSADQIEHFEKLYGELEPKLRVINLGGEEFMSQIRDSYRRYQEFKNLDPFSPMDKKGLKYVISFMKKAIDKTYQGVKQKKS